MNVYGFVGNKPLRNVDYLGLKCCDAESEDIKALADAMAEKAGAETKKIIDGLWGWAFEYCGSVCCDGSGTLSTTGLTRGYYLINGDQSLRNVRDLKVNSLVYYLGTPFCDRPKCADPLKTVAGYHSHPKGGSGGPSRGDEDQANEDKRNYCPDFYSCVHVPDVPHPGNPVIPF